MKSRIEKCMKSAVKNYTSVFQNDNLKANIQQIVTESVTAFQSDKKMLFCGNGGSASDAQHIAAELSGRFYADRPPLYAEALHVNSSFMTAVANDYGYEATYARMGDFLKNNCKGYLGYIFTGNLELAKKIRLKPSRRIEFYNATIDCRLLEYEMYAGTKRTDKLVDKGEEENGLINT